MNKLVQFIVEKSNKLFSSDAVYQNLSNTIRYHWSILVLIVGYFGFCIYTELYRSIVPEWYWQLLPKEALLEQPILSIIQLHAQPPIYNIIYWLVLTISKKIDVELNLVSGAFNLLLSTSIIGTAYLLVYFALKKRTYSFFVALVIAMHPGLVYHQFVFLYTPIESVLILSVLIFIQRYSETLRLWSVVCILISINILVLTRSLWHPVIIIFCLIGIVVYSKIVGKYLMKSKYFMFVAVISVIPSIAFMSKNYFLFGSFGLSSWVSMNLGDSGIKDFFAEEDKEIIIQSTEKFYSSSILEWHQNSLATSMIYKNVKGDNLFKANANHYSVPVLNSKRTSQVVDLYTNNPSAYLERCFVSIACLHAPTYVDPYSINVYNGEYSIDLGFLTKYSKTYGFPFFEEISSIEFAINGQKYKLSLTLFLFLFFPGYFLLLIRHFLKHPLSSNNLLLLTFLLFQLWFILMVVFVDGRESNRMRWAIEPAWIICFFILLKQLLVDLLASYNYFFLAPTTTPTHSNPPPLAAIRRGLRRSSLLCTTNCCVVPQRLALNSQRN